MKPTCPCESRSAVADQAMRRRLPLRLSHWFSKAAGKCPERRRSNCLDGLGDILPRDQLVPGVAADEGGEVVAGGDLAGAVEADDAAGGIEDGDQRADGVEDGGDEVALDGEGGLDALAGAGGAIHLANAAVELEAVDDLAAEDARAPDCAGVSMRAGPSSTRSAPMLTPPGVVRGAPA